MADYELTQCPAQLAPQTRAQSFDVTRKQHLIAPKEFVTTNITLPVTRCSGNDA